MFDSSRQDRVLDDGRPAVPVHDRPADAAGRPVGAGSLRSVQLYRAAGDTLWSYASAITPDGGDVRDTIDDLISLNHLDGVSLQVGQQLKVPIV